MKLKKGDTVRVITGKDKGKEGVVERVIPTADKVIVSGVNTAAKHQRARRANDKGGIIDRDMPIHASNVMLVHKGKTVRVGYGVDKNGNKVRIARPTGEVIS
jgi:large subunit ribosomal protein L24